MKRIIAAILFAFAVLAPSLAHAALCKPPDAKYIHAGKVGEHWWVYWWCPDATWQWSTQSPPQYTAAGVEAGTAFWLGLDVPPVPMSPPADVIAQLRAGVAAAVAADTNRPPKALWVVGKTGYDTRPTYPATDGVRSTKSDGRATVGATCDCSSPIIEGKTTYCPLMATGIVGAIIAAPKTVSVTVCTMVQP